MPSGYVRPDTPTTVWGTLDRGSFDAPPAGTTFAWIFRHDADVSVAPATPLSGSVTDGRNIAVTCTFSLENGATSARVQAVLTLAGPGGESRATTWLRIVSNQDPLADTPRKSLDIDRRIAIENALHWLYLRQHADGSWPYQDAAGCTATVLWAFENAGHTPDADPAVDVYQPAVKAALEYILGASEYMAITTTAKGNPDVDGNGRGVYLAKNRTPAVTTAGMTGDLGADGYTHAMCLAALCASGTPNYITHAGPFDNAGAGTPLLDIVQDAADFDTWKLGRGGSGGWSYSYDDTFWTDMSIASWNYVALEAARQFGAAVPEWAPAWCEHLLPIVYVPNDGFFSYQWGDVDNPNASAATTASGLSGLVFVADNGRAPAFDAGKMAVQALDRIGALWRDLSRNSYTFFGDTYQMWTMARALRMAGVSRLNSPDGPFDWQRNITPVGDAHEGVWPYLVRTQKPAGYWKQESGPLAYENELTTAWAVLCLAEGVIGPEAVWHDVEVTASLPADTGNEIVPGSFTGPEPAIADTGAEHRLTWFVGAVSAGQSFDFSFDQVLDNIVPGEFRGVQNSLTVSCFTRQSQFLEDVRGPLGVTVAPSLYNLTVAADRDAYELSDVARFTVDLELPPGQAFQRISAPTAGAYVLEPDLADSGATWTTLDFDLLNPQDFAAGDTPVAVRARSAPTRAALATTPFSDPITTSGSPLPCPPGRFLELDVAFATNPSGVMPRIGFITVWYNIGTARFVLDVLTSDGAGVAAPAQFNVFPADYGTILHRTVDWTVHNLPPGSRALIRARLIMQDGTRAAGATDDFNVTGPDSAGVLVAALAPDKPVYLPYSEATLSSTLRNSSSELTLANLSVAVDVLNPQGLPVTGGHLSFTVPHLAPDGETTRRLVWNTGDRTPGTWQVRQVVTGADGTTLSTSVANFEISGTGGLGYTLAGQIETRPRTVVHPDTFDVDWTVENRGNAALRNFRVQLTISPEPGARTRGWRSLVRSVDIAQLAPGASSAGTWTGLPSSELPEGPYLALLEAVQGRGNPTALDAAPLTVRARTTDTVPPSTVHDYAFDGTWVRHDARITLTATDNPGGSGVKQTSWTVGGATTPGTTIAISDEGTWTVAFRSEDNAGNIEPDNTLTVKLDKTTPTVTAALAPAPNANGWNNTDVTVTFAATDTLSGVHSVTDPVTGTAEGANQQVQGQAVDTAGNTATVTAIVNLDRTPPTVAARTPADGTADASPDTVVSTVVHDDLAGVDPGALEAKLNGAVVAHLFDSGTGLLRIAPGRVLSPGLNTIDAILEDRAGNRTRTQWSFSVRRNQPAQNPVLFANPTGSNRDGLVLNGLGATIRGSIHSNGDVCISGRSLRIEGQVTAVGRVRAGKNLADSGRITENCATLPFPEFNAREYRLQAQFVHKRSLVLRTIGSLPDGIHYVRGNVYIFGPVHARATIVAEGDIKVFSKSARIEPYDTTNDMLFFCLGRRVHITGVANRFTGLVYAPNGCIEVGGRFNRFERARIYGRQVLVTAYRTLIAGSLKGRVRSSAPQGVPFTVERGRVLPRAPWSGWADVLGGSRSPRDRSTTLRLIVGEHRLASQTIAARPDPRGDTTVKSTARIPFPSSSEPMNPIALQARSLRKSTRHRRSWWRRFRPRWTTGLTVDSRTTPENVRVLCARDPLPKATTAPGPLPDWLAPMVRQNRLSLPANQVLFLLELDTRDSGNAEFDFRDLGVLVTLTPPRAKGPDSR